MDNNSFAAGMLPGERFQAALGGRPMPIPQWIWDNLRASCPQVARVISVDYSGARVEVSNSNGSAWARVLKRKSSGRLAGEIDMPNEGDTGVVSSLNGDSKSLVWLGSLNTIEKSTTVDTDGSFFPMVSDLVHALFRKHETGSFWLLNKLGKLTSALYRRAATEDDAAKKHINIEVNNDGSVTLTHYRGDNALKSTEFSMSKDGVFSLNIYKDDGVTPALSFDVQSKGTTGGTCVLENDAHQVQLVSVPGSEIFQYLHKKKNTFVIVTERGDLNINSGGSGFTMEADNGDVTVSHKSGTYVSVEQDAVEVETQDGSTIIVGKDQAQIALSTGQSIVFDNDGDIIELTAGNINIDCDLVQLGSSPVQQPLMTTGMLIQMNIERALMAAHTHGGAVPADVTLAPLAVPILPTPAGNCTAQATGA